MLAIIELTMDCADAAGLAEFWKGAVGYAETPPPAPYTSQAEYIEASIDPEDDDGLRVRWLSDPDKVAPNLCLLEVPEPKTVKNRLHMDLNVAGEGTPDEQWEHIKDVAARLEGRGATVLAEYDHHHVAMADPEGNEFDLC